MKETEFINDKDLNNIEAFFGDIDEIKPMDDTADGIDEKDIEALRDDIRIKEVPTVNFITDDDNLKVQIKVEGDKAPDSQKNIREILDDNALNDSISVDMDMNKADDPAEVGHTDAEKLLTVDVDKVDRLSDKLTKYFRRKYREGEEVVYDALLLDKMAEYFSTRDKIFEEQVNPDKILYTPEEYKKNIDERKKEYLSDPFFVNFLKIEASSEYVYAHGLSGVRDNYQSLRHAAADNINGNLSPFLGRHLKSGVIDYDTLKTRCQNKAERLSSSRSANARFIVSDYMDAADLIVAKTLTTKAAKNSIIEKCKTADSANIDLSKFNEQINEMRKEISRDPIFLKVMADHTPKRDFYKAYRNAVNAEINKNIKAGSQRKKQLKNNAAMRDFATSFLDTSSYNIAPDRIEIIQSTYADLAALNKGKDPSEYMQKLTDAYEDVIKEIAKNGGYVKASTINTLHKAALKYYDKRQGIISGPSTGKGQARLETVEKLIKTTEPLIKTISRDFNKSYKSFKAAQDKVLQNADNKKKSPDKAPRI